MTFKKYLRTKNDCRAQAALEYFIILTILALITLLSVGNFHNQMIAHSQTYFQEVVVGTHGLNVENN
jgi:hypothetical protein